jgi:hypothetical protein
VEEGVCLEITKKFDEFQELLKELMERIAENCSANVADSTFQLKKINSTINELKKNNIAVPDELIKLKLSLSSQVDRVKDAERIRKELIRCLELNVSELKDSVPEKPVKKEKNKKITIQERVNLVDLINALIIPSNIEFYAYYKNNRYSATLLPDGSLEMIEKKKKKSYESHRAAAIAITGYQIDPWKFWKLDFEGKPLTLDDYRKKYLKKKQKEGNTNSDGSAELVAEI